MERLSVDAYVIGVCDRAGAAGHATVGAGWNWACRGGNHDQGTATTVAYVPGSTHKINQLVGELDKQTHQSTLSRTGPWSVPQLLFNARNDGALGQFIHDRENPAAVHGGAYAPYMVEHWTKVRRRSAGDGEPDIYYMLSTWNPYVVVLMASRLRISA